MSCPLLLSALWPHKLAAQAKPTPPNAGPSLGQSAAESSTSAPETPTAPSTLRDERYAVSLGRPAPHWRLLGPSEASRLSPIALMGAVEPGRSFGLILAEPARGMSLDGYAQTLLNHSPLDELLVEVAEAITYQGVESLKLVYSGDNEQGARVRYLSYVFLRDGFAFQVSAGGKVGAVSSDDLESFSRVVTLLPGPVRGASLELKPLSDELGLTWRVQGGRFESLISSFTLTPPEGWSLQVGEAARAVSPIATLSMSKRVPSAQGPGLDLSLLISARPCADEPKRCGQWARAELIEAFELSPRQEGQLEWRLFGEPASFELFDRDGTPFSYALHSVVRGGELLQILAWTLKDQLPHAWGPLPEALSALSELPLPERAALKATLSAALRADEGAALRGDSLDALSAWLGGRYEHEGYQASWRQPSGLWSARRLERGETLSALAFEAPLYGLSGQLRLSRRGGGLIEAHSEALAALKRELGLKLKSVASGQGRLGGHLSHWTELEEEGERPLRYRLHSTLNAGVAAYMITWAPAPRFPRPVVEQAEANLQLGGLPAPFSLTQRCTEGSCEARLALPPMRFALEGLPTGGDVQLFPNASLGTRSMSLSYTTDEVLIGALAVGHARADALDPLAVAAAQRLLPQLNEASLQPKRVWLRGREARALSWTSERGEVRLYLIKRPPLIYGYFVIAPAGHPLLKSGRVALTFLDER